MTDYVKTLHPVEGVKNEYFDDCGATWKRTEKTARDAPETVFHLQRFWNGEPTGKPLDVSSVFNEMRIGMTTVKIAGGAE